MYKYPDVYRYQVVNGHRQVGVCNYQVWCILAKALWPHVYMGHMTRNGTTTAGLTQQYAYKSYRQGNVIGFWQNTHIFSHVPGWPWGCVQVPVGATVRQINIAEYHITGILDDPYP